MSEAERGPDDLAWRALLARLASKYPPPTDSGPTCAICGVVARYDGGRLSWVHDEAKHFQGRAPAVTANTVAPPRTVSHSHEKSWYDHDDE